MSFADGVATVQRALELGINYFDTAPLYTRGLAQAILGVSLEGRQEPHLLATKLGHLAQPSRFRSPDALHTQFEENLRLLRRVVRLAALQQESGLSLVTLTLRYLVADRSIATILVGAATPAEIGESVAAVQAGPLAADLHRAVDALGLP